MQHSCNSKITHCPPRRVLLQGFVSLLCDYSQLSVPSSSLLLVPMLYFHSLFAPIASFLAHIVLLMEVRAIEVVNYLEGVSSWGLTSSRSSIIIS